MCPYPSPRHCRSWPDLPERSADCQFARYELVVEKEGVERASERVAKQVSAGGSFLRGSGGWVVNEWALGAVVVASQGEPEWQPKKPERQLQGRILTMVTQQNLHVVVSFHLKLTFILSAAQLGGENGGAPRIRVPGSQ